MKKRLKTIAVSEETYALLVELKERTNSNTMDEATRKHDRTLQTGSSPRSTQIH